MMNPSFPSFPPMTRHQPYFEDTLIQTGPERRKSCSLVFHCSVQSRFALKIVRAKSSEARCWFQTSQQPPDPKRRGVLWIVRPPACTIERSDECVLSFDHGDSLDCLTWRTVRLMILAKEASRFCVGKMTRMRSLWPPWTMS